MLVNRMYAAPLGVSDLSEGEARDGVYFSGQPGAWSSKSVVPHTLRCHLSFV